MKTAGEALFESNQTPPPAGNGIDPLSPAAQEQVEERLKPALDYAAALLLPNPGTLASKGEQLVIPPVKIPSAVEFFQTHPTIRMTIAMCEPKKGELGSLTYAVWPTAHALMERYKIALFEMTLFPIVIDSRPLTYKLVMVRLPSNGRQWDNFNLSRKLCLDMAVGKWKAMRPIKGGYEAVDPDPEAKFQEPVFPDWTTNDWLEKSLGATDRVIHDSNHPIIKELLHL